MSEPHTNKHPEVRKPNGNHPPATPVSPAVPPMTPHTFPHRPTQAVSSQLPAQQVGTAGDGQGV